jgi:hypothetical protein
LKWVRATRSPACAASASATTKSPPTSSTSTQANHGLDGLKTGDVERFYRDVVDPLRTHGGAVVILDHLPKATEGRGKWAIGSERKIGACDVHLGLEVIHPFGRGKTGKAKITTHKDRHGYLPRPRAGELELTSDPETELITWQITLADQEQNTEPFRPTFLMQRISEYLELQTEPVSRNSVEQNVKGKSTDAKRLALDVLTHEKLHQRDTRRTRRTPRLLPTPLPRDSRDDFAYLAGPRLNLAPGELHYDLASSPDPLQGGEERGEVEPEFPSNEHHHLA